MFICSICQEAFIQDDNSVYSTPCGHIFHHKCLMPWLNNHRNCPQCRAKVSERHLTKLYFELDSAVESMYTKEAQEELNTLRNKIEILKGLDISAQTSSVVQEEYKKLKNVHRALKNSNKELKCKVNRYKSKITELSNQLLFLNLNYNQLRDNKTTVENNLLLKQADNRTLSKCLYGLQSQNSVIIEKLKSEIADLKEKINVLENCVSGNNSNLSITLKEYIANDRATSQMKLNENSPIKQLAYNNFLLGCIFLIVEERCWFNSMRTDLSNFEKKIIDFGGLVVDTYLPCVTHIICVTQKNPVVQQAIKDKKRCVTDYWLYDVISEKKCLSPWLAHHFPAPYSEETGLPCHQFQIAVVNFDVNKYQIVKSMVEYTGARVVDEVSPSTNIVVSLTLESKLVERAQALNIPVVNVKWLSDVICGSQVHLLNPNNIVYQQFDLNNPYSVSTNMVSHLMDAWKTPILNTQQRPSGLETTAITPEMFMQIDEANQ